MIACVDYDEAERIDAATLPPFSQLLTLPRVQQLARSRVLMSATATRAGSALWWTCDECVRAARGVVTCPRRRT